MSALPPNFSETANGSGTFVTLAQRRAKEALQVSSDYTHKNPMPIVLGALLIGVGVGFLCTRRDPKPKDAKEIARMMVDDLLGQLTDRLPSRKQMEQYPENLRAGFNTIGRRLHLW